MVGEVSPCAAISFALNTPLPPLRGFKRQPRNAPALEFPNSMLIFSVLLDDDCE
jgi:hypothetical protein